MKIKCSRLLAIYSYLIQKYAFKDLKTEKGFLRSISPSAFIS